MNNDLKAFQQAMVRLAKRIDKIESKLIEIESYIEYLKDLDQKQSKFVKKQKTKEKMEDIKYNTLKKHLGDMIK